MHSITRPAILLLDTLEVPATVRPQGPAPELSAQLQHPSGTHYPLVLTLPASCLAATQPTLHAGTRVRPRLCHLLDQAGNLSALTHQTQSAGPYEVILETKLLIY